jgi:ABC-type transporter Mla subunit MlaD
MIDTVFKSVTGIVKLRGNSDATPIGNVADRLKVDISESPLPDGAATEQTLIEIKNAVDGLEGFTDDLESLAQVANTLLTTIRDNGDQLENYTDGIEGLVTTTNSILTSISGYVDQLEEYTDGIEGLVGASNVQLEAIAASVVQLETFTDGLEALIGTTNTTLTTIAGHVDQLESFTDGIEGLLGTANTQLSAIAASVDQLESFTDGIETLLTGIQSAVDQLEGYLDGVETQLGATNETAPVSDTAVSGLNGRLQRIAQNITAFIAIFKFNFGVSTDAVRTAAQVGNANGAADFNSGIPGAQTLRTAAALFDALANALTTRSYASVRPLDVYLPQLGAGTATRTTFTPAANTNTLVLAANPNRKWVIFANHSGAAYFIQYGVAAGIDQGIEILQNGGRYEMTANNLYLGAINAIVGSNGRTLEIIEGT